MGNILMNPTIWVLILKIIKKSELFSSLIDYKWLGECFFFCLTYFLKCYLFLKNIKLIFLKFFLILICWYKNKNKIIKIILIYFYFKNISEKHSALLNKHPKSNEIIKKSIKKYFNIFLFKKYFWKTLCIIKPTPKVKWNYY